MPTKTELTEVIDNARFVVDEVTQHVKDRSGYIGVENMEQVREVFGHIAELARLLEYFMPDA